MDKPNSLNLLNFNFPCITEDKYQGFLSVYESDDLPFKVKRVFSVVNLQRGSKRGLHAHKKCNQLISCIAGEINLICDNGKKREERLLSPHIDAILIPAGIWAEQDYLEDNSVIIVFCDNSYDENDYIRDYDEYLKWKRNK